MNVRAAAIFLLPLCAAADPQSGARYAGERVCASCHRDIARRQSTTAMARTWQGAATTVLPPAYNESVSEGANPAFHYQIRRQDSRLVFSTTALGSPRIDLPVEAVVGGARHGLSFFASLSELNGIPLARRVLIEARFVYNTPNRKLALSPGFSSDAPASFESAFGRVLSPDFETKCLTCHGRPGTAGAGSLGGVHCESCHGPALSHVEAVSQGHPRQGVLNPASLSPDKSLEVCAPCHSGFSPLADPMPDDLLVSNQVNALRNSECFLQSGGSIRCTSCHDPHDDAANVPAASVSTCLRCHSPAAQPRAALCPVNASSGCVGCHMPAVQKGVFRMTDHWIRAHASPAASPASPPPAGSASAVVPLRESLRIIVASDRANAELARARIAKGEPFAAVAHDLSEDPTSPGGGFIGDTLLSDLDPRLAAAAQRLGYGQTSALIDMGGRWMLLARENRGFKFEANRLFEEASALKLHGDRAGALRKDQEALAVYPFFLRALVLMGVTLGEAGDLQRAAQVLQFAAGQYRSDPTAQFDLGLVLGGLHQPAAQIAAFRRALELDPGRVAAYESLGSALFSSGDSAGAIATFRDGLQVDPLSASLNFDLSLALRDHGDPREAESLARLARVIDPSLPRGEP